MSDRAAQLEKLEKARDLNDLVEIEAACRAILNENIEDEISHRCRYQLGLCLLWREENLDEAMGLFAQAAKHPSKDDFSRSARTSHAICLWHSGQKSKAVFELRKMLPQGTEPNMHTATALDFLVLFLKESNSDEKSIQQTQAIRLTHLSHLQREAENPAARGHWKLRLAVALAELGDGPSRSQAKSLCQEVLKQKEMLNDTTVDSAQELLQSL